LTVHCSVHLGAPSVYPAYGTTVLSCKYFSVGSKSLYERGSRSYVADLRDDLPVVS
jgi:hypothetical protein